MTVDEILASGRYTDRRGREWEVTAQDSPYGPAWGYWEQPFGIQALIATQHLRTIIESDRHRDECPGLRLCFEHPTPVVVIRRGSFDIYAPELKAWNGTYDTLSGAITAASALAVGE